MTDELTLAGYRVWEAFAVSEVLHLIEHEDIDGVVWAPDVHNRKRAMIALISEIIAEEEAVVLG
jgi:hypothetical protein